MRSRKRSQWRLGLSTVTDFSRYLGGGGVTGLNKGSMVRQYTGTTPHTQHTRGVGDVLQVVPNTIPHTLGTPKSFNRKEFGSSGLVPSWRRTIMNQGECRLSVRV